MDPLTGQYTYAWDNSASEYKDYDFAIITDFDENDNLVLSGNLTEYSIGNAPADLKTPGGSIGSKGTNTLPTQFGIYYTGSAYGSTNPNLVAVIQTADPLLLGALTSRPFQASPTTSTLPALPQPAAGTAPMGWDDGNDFYHLDGSGFAQYVNQTYTQRASTASLSTLINQIV